MSEIKNGGLDQYGVELFEPQQFARAGVEGVNVLCDFMSMCATNRCMFVGLNVATIGNGEGTRTYHLLMRAAVRKTSHAHNDLPV